MADNETPAEPDSTPLRRTALFELHQRLGARLVPFAGYEMPLRYQPGPIAEHQQTRSAASLFDVSHMGIVEVSGSGVAEALEALVPGGITTLGPQRLRYTVLTTADGGVIDDLVVTNAGAEQLSIVFNASRKAVDTDHLRAELPSGFEVEPREDLALLALQGPAAVEVIARHVPDARALVFQQATRAYLGGIPVGLSRSGYTGEDGFEITVAADAAVALAEVLLGDERVAPAGLAARDSLRLEAGLCLYGHELDEATTPAEAGLGWSIPRRRREDQRFPGAARIVAQLRDGPPRHRVGIVAEGRKPIRDGAGLRLAEAAAATSVGAVTSGGFGPTSGGPVAMGYVAAGHEAPGTQLIADVRGAPVPCRIVELPFVPHRYVRGR